MIAQIKQLTLHIDINRAFKFLTVNRTRRKIEFVEMESRSDISVKPMVQHIKIDNVIDGLSILQCPQTDTNNLYVTPYQGDL